MVYTTQMHRHIRIRDAVTPYCVFIERQFPPILSQPFRRLQHLIFGLTEDEWNTLSTYFVHFEDLGVTVQLETGLERETQRLKRILKNELSRGELPRPDLVEKYTNAVHKRAMNQQASRLAFDKWKATADGLGNTALSRGLSSNREMSYWWYTRWLDKQCAQAEGAVEEAVGAVSGRRYGILTSELGVATARRLVLVVSSISASTGRLSSWGAVGNHALTRGRCGRNDSIAR